MYMATPVLMNLSLKLNICFRDDVEKFAGYKPSPKYQAGGKINRPGQLAPRLCNQAYETERQGILLNLTCIMTAIDAT